MKLTKNEIAIRGVVSELFATMLCNGGKLQLSENTLLTIGASSDDYAIEGEDYDCPTDILLITDIKSESPEVKVIDDDNKNHRALIYQEYDTEFEPTFDGGNDRTLEHIDKARERYHEREKKIESLGGKVAVSASASVYQQAERELDECEFGNLDSDPELEDYARVDPNEDREEVIEQTLELGERARLSEK